MIAECAGSDAQNDCLLIFWSTKEDQTAYPPTQSETERLTINLPTCHHGKSHRLRHHMTNNDPFLGPRFIGNQRQRHMPVGDEAERQDPRSPVMDHAVTTSATFFEVGHLNGIGIRTPGGLRYASKRRVHRKTWALGTHGLSVGR